MRKLIVMALVTLLFSRAVTSAVIDQDWQTSGDSKLLFDTATNMRWLDLSVTADMSHDTVVSNLGVGGLFEGWRLATQNEVLELWNHAGITNTERVWVTYQYSEVNDLVTRLGPTTMFEEGLFNIATHTVGMVEGGLVLTPTERWAMELTYAPDGLNTRTSASHYTWDVGIASLHYSTYLVQTIPMVANGDLAPWDSPNNQIDTADVLIAIQLILGLRIPGALQYAHGDMNGDGLIDLVDLMQIQRIVFQ